MKVKEKRRSGPYPYWFLIVPGIIYVIFFIVPTISSFYYSFTRWDLFTATWIGFKNYQSFFAEQALVIGLRNTVIYAVVTCGLKVVIGMALAVLCTSHKYCPRLPPVGHLLPGPGQHGRGWCHVRAT